MCKRLFSKKCFKEAWSNPSPVFAAGAAGVFPMRDLLADRLHTQGGVEEDFGWAGLGDSCVCITEDFLVLCCIFNGVLVFIFN